ncbi:MAG TPA: hypothetical protein VL749_12775 [Patescibacteria group bacterium]|nr:hypothetical protein [Patescibacteria group bacterium]
MRTIVRGWRARLLTLATAAALTACESAPQATPTSAASSSAASPEVTTAPSPTTEPVDVVKLFTDRADDFDSGVVTFEGTVTVGLVQVRLSGNSTFSGPDNRTITATTVGGVQAQVETIQVAGKRYLRNGEGPWLEVPVTSSSGDLTSQVGSAAKGSLRDEGTEQRQGQTVHKLVPTSTAGFDPSSLLSSVSGVEGMKVDLAFFVAEDGTPVTAAIGATWSQKVATQSVAGSLQVDLVFSHMGQAQTVTIPSGVWQRFSSSRYHFQVARPPDWTYFKAKDADEFDAPYYAYVLGNRHKTQGATLNAIAKVEATALKSFVGGKAVSNEAGTLGGATARFLSASGKSKQLGKTVQVYESIAVKGGFVYYVLWVSEVGHADEDLALFEQILGTFGFS